MEIKNRKAQHEFLFKQSFEAGIILDGAEVKSIREGNANINDAFVISEIMSCLSAISM